MSQPADHSDDGMSRRAERLSPDQVARWEFPRTGVAKRGIDEESVHRFKRRILADLQTTSQIEADLRARITDLAAQLRASYSGASAPSAGGGGGGASPFAPAQQQVTAAAVNAISAAQRHAEEQIRAAEEYVRNVTEYARNQYQATVNEGHRQGLLAAETAFQRRSEALSANLGQLESQLDFLKAFGMAFGVQVEASLEKARDEVHTMIGTIRTAFDVLKQPGPSGVGGVGGQGGVAGQPVPQGIGG